ncbi:MAG: Wzz/FepE/Etk N-terminal domain-containing protein [Lactococcus lactis]|nr:Wzz/FepE/Etk N-terminal domain-containing protein [Lactococcus lactis]
MEYRMKPKELSKFIRFSGIVISLLTLFGILVTFGMNEYAFKPRYSSSVQLLAKQSKENSDNSLNNYQANIQAITTYKDLVKSDDVLGLALKNYKVESGESLSLKRLTQEVSITNNENSTVFSVNVVDDSSHRASDLANLVAKSLQYRVRKLTNSNIVIVTHASNKDTPIYPNKKLNIFIGAILGALIGSFVSLLYYLLKPRKIPRRRNNE